MSYSEKNGEAVINYLHDNYYDDMEKMAHIKMIATLTTDVNTHYDSIPSMIDKVALFNSIQKSYPPKAEELAREFIEGIGFIMTLEKTSKDWNY